jgi:hypothetical protein
MEKEREREREGDAASPREGDKSIFVISLFSTEENSSVYEIVSR